MTISLTNLTNRTRDVDVYKKLGAARELWGKLNVEYYLSPDWNLEKDSQRVGALNGGDVDEIIQANTDYATASIAQWDLTDDDGNVLEINSDVLRSQVPSSILTDILNAIGKDRGSAAPSKKR